jgi:serine/threonine protein kinase
VWAFGCLLYECLSGQAAFPGETARERLVAPLEHVPDWTRLPARTPAAVREILARCLAREREGRPRGLGEVRLALEQESQSAIALARRVAHPSILQLVASCGGLRQPDKHEPGLSGI